MAAADCSNHTKREDATIRRALRILESRLREPGEQMNSPYFVRHYLALRFAELEHEIFAVVFMDVQNRVIATEEMIRGTLKMTAVFPREIVKRALVLNASCVILAHNHPSGVAKPSQADYFLTDQLKTALALVDVQVNDHFIIAGTSGYSFADHGALGLPVDSTPTLLQVPAKPASRRGRPRKVKPTMHAAAG